MIEIAYDKYSNIFFYGLACLGFVLIYLLIQIYPLHPDDWEYMYVYSYDASATKKISGISDIIDSQYKHYFEWGGRVIATSIAHILLMLGKTASDIITSGFYIFFIYLMCLYTSNKKGGKDPLLFLFYFLMLWLLVPYFPGVVLWITGAATYLYVIIIVLLFLYPFYKYLMLRSSMSKKLKVLSLIMKKILDLYSDYLLCSTGQTSATGLSSLVDGSLSHDQISRFLRGSSLDSKNLWHHVKPLVREFENDDACLIFDDTIIEKAYMDENELICWHWDHSKSRNVKGINLLSAFYVSGKPLSDELLRVPLSYELIKKTIHFCEIKTKKEKRQSAVTKNELLRDMISQQIRNQLIFKYVLADSWFSSCDNMRFIASKKKVFIFDMKSNRLAALDETARNKGLFQNIDQLEIAENTPVKVWLKDLKMQVLLIKQVFINKDQSIGVRFLVSNDLTLSEDQFTTLYKKRWSVEEYHKSIKQNASIAKSPASSVKGQSNHLFASIFTFVKLEKMKLAQSLNHFAIKTKIYMASLRAAFIELNKMNKQIATA